MGILGNTTTVVAPVGTTAWNCFDHKKGTFKFKYNEQKTVETLKKAGTTSAGTALSGTLQFGGELSTTYLDDMYAGAMSAEQISEMERLLAQKELEFTVGGITYDLSEIDPAEGIRESSELQSGKAYVKKL